MPREGKRKAPLDGRVHYETLDFLDTVSSTGFIDTIKTSYRRVRRELVVVEAPPQSPQATTSAPIREPSGSELSDPLDENFAPEENETSCRSSRQAKKKGRATFTSTASFYPFSLL